MARIPLLALAVLALAAGGCRTEEPKLPAACRGAPASIAAALRVAPAPVRLRDGTRLSTCLRRARSDAELQGVGLAFTSVADALAARIASSDAVAVELGYLIAAARRGAQKTNGVGLELQRRLEQSVGVDGPPPARRAAFSRGAAAGKRTG
jgi:hypothetical protein